MSSRLSTSSAGRNYGVDALRCAAMLLIVCLHVMNRGGAIPAAGTAAALWLYPLRALASAAVNMYALISGFVMLHGKFHPARIFELWLQVWVLNAGIGLIGIRIDPEAMDTAFWIRYLFPFTQKAYWYFSAYVGVYAFSPLVNRSIRALDRIQAIALLWIMLLLFSLCGTLGYLNQGDPFSIGGGYSVLWLLALYVVGACIRQAGFLRRTPSRRLLALLLLTLAVLTLLFTVVSSSDAPEFLHALNGRLLDYISPLITLISVLMLLLFSRLRFGRRAQPLIAFFSPLTFGVYIIHVHHVVWMPLQGLFRPLLKLPGALLPLAVILSALGLFLCCAAVDWLRQQLFRLLHVRQAADGLERVLRRTLCRMVGQSNESN
ncbi:MAG: acyltransferase [Oscillospiraceae bacterium]|nr:acyltransferase [Oscillospiraceae bacterium]